MKKNAQTVQRIAETIIFVAEKIGKRIKYMLTNWFYFGFYFSFYGYCHEKGGC